MVVPTTDTRQLPPTASIRCTRSVRRKSASVTRIPISHEFYDDTPTTFPQHGNPDAIAYFAPFGPFDSSDHNSSPNEWEGPNEIAFAPSNFPDGLNKAPSFFFMGSSKRSGRPFQQRTRATRRNPVVFYDLATGASWHFIRYPTTVYRSFGWNAQHVRCAPHVPDGRRRVHRAPTNTGATHKVMAVSPGNVNHDGKFDAADYVIWARTEWIPQKATTRGVPSSAETTGGGLIETNVTPVPESTSIVMLFGGDTGCVLA